MSLLTSLYQTYEKLLDQEMVDNVRNLNQPGKAVLLPVFHSNKRAATVKDIIEITIDENGHFITAEYLDKNNTIIFPITERSIVRANSPAAHPISDTLAYVTNIFDQRKHDIFLHELSEWHKFDDEHRFLNAVYKYILGNTLVSDTISAICPKSNYAIDKKHIVVNYIENDKEKQEKITEKLFVTFKLETEIGPNVTISNDKSLHQSYVSYVRALNDFKEQSVCDISGELTYCSDKHRPLFGTAKLISVSNHTETYKGRIQDGSNLISIGYETSQKIHNMIKYLSENYSTSNRLKNDSIFITWSSQRIEEVEIDITGSQVFYQEEDDQLSLSPLLMGLDFENDYTIGEQEAETISKAISGYLDQNTYDFHEAKFFVAELTKVSNGRVSIKFFRELYMSDLADKLSNWYATTNWQYGSGQYKKIMTPSFYQIALRTYGHFENDRIVLRKDEMINNVTENLIRCVIDGQKIPINIIQQMKHNLQKRVTYKNTWLNLVETACSLFKKYQWDYKNKEVKSELDKNNTDRSYLYGRLAAIYEQIEMKSSPENEQHKLTNLEKYWSQFMNYPEQTHVIIRRNIQPYLDRLKKNSYGLFRYYNRYLEEIIIKLEEQGLSDRERNKAVDEEFIFGYYSQRKELYIKKSQKNEEIIDVQETAL